MLGLLGYIIKSSNMYQMPYIMLFPMYSKTSVMSRMFKPKRISAGTNIYF